MSNYDISTQRRSDESPAEDSKPDHPTRSNPLEEFSYAELNRSCPGISDHHIDVVFAALCNHVRTVGPWISGGRLGIDELSDKQAGRALAELAKCPECPLEIDRWSDGGNPITYHVSIPTIAEKELVTDGGRTQSMDRITVRIPPQLRTAVESHAEDEFQSVSEFVRESIRAHLRRKRRERHERNRNRELMTDGGHPRLVEEIATDCTNPMTARKVRGLGDIRQTHLDARWWE